MDNKTTYILSAVVCLALYFIFHMLIEINKEKDNCANKLNSKDDEIQNLKSQMKAKNKKLNHTEMKNNELSNRVKSLRQYNQKILNEKHKLSSKITHYENIVKANNEQFKVLEDKLKELEV